MFILMTRFHEVIRHRGVQVIIFFDNFKINDGIKSAPGFLLSTLVISNSSGFQ